jgi:hypothetical protein
VAFRFVWFSRAEKVLNGCAAVQVSFMAADVKSLTKQLVGIIQAVNSSERKKAMMKTMEVISEAVRNTRHPFRKADNQPKKAQKNRYERRKIKEYLHLADWLAEEMA